MREGGAPQQLLLRTRARVSGKKPLRWLRRLRGPRRDWRLAREHKALAASLTRERQWRSLERRTPDADELYRIFARSDGALKWLHYFDAYAQAFAPFRDRPINLLEIGVLKGGSLRMWKEYFHPGSRIVGIDNASDCAAFDDPDSNIFVRIGEQQDEKFLRTLIEELGPFDIVLDDGSHMASHVVQTFNVLFAEGMRDESVYVVEDLHTNYHPGFIDSPVRFLDIVKHLIDLMHAHYRDMHHLPQTAFHDASEPTAFTVPAVTTLLDQIQIFDSLVILHRRAGRETPLLQESKQAARHLAAASSS